MSKKLTTEEFIEKARKIHSDKYDYSKVEYVNSKTKVCIICPEHGEFWQIPNAHLKGQGCSKCAKIKTSDIKRKTTDVFINELKTIFGDEYDYSKVNYINNRVKVCIICPEHGEFEMKPLHLIHKHGCPKCAGRNRTTDEFIEKARQIHGDKYDYLNTVYNGSHKIIKIICPKHGLFTQTPHLHLRGHGCLKCYEERRGFTLRPTTEEFIEKARKVHGNKYDYNKVEYINTETKVCIICSEHGEFWQTPHDHLQGCGCPKCSHTTSRNEEEICNFVKNILNINNIEIRNKSVISPLELDLYLPEHKLAIEYNGVWWHSEAYGKDKNYHLNKLNECNVKGTRLIHIFEDEYLEHKDIVLSKIKHLLGKDNDLPKVQARKCKVNEIDRETALQFLEKNHIQGFVTSTLYLGCYYNNVLVGVMTFKEERKGNNRWELNRFATDITKRCIGVGGKLFKYFIKTYNPDYIKSFADRRWTLDKDNNLYTKLGFTLGEVLKPDYRYVNRLKREHKFGFRKQILMKKYPDKGLTMEMTEKEMCDKLGFYRIWDCGLFKFEWFNKN